MVLVAYCRVAGDPHYITFDRTSLQFAHSYYNFMGLCEYEIVSPCHNESDIPWHITAKVSKQTSHIGF